MTQPILDTAKEKMTKTAALLRKELAALRAGRANPQLLDRITVDYYGTPTPLNQLGNISAPEARQLVIALWDPKLIPQVEKAILKSDLGMTPANDGKIIRLVVPELNEERRKELTKLVRKSCEESKVAVRAIRRDAVEQFKKLRKSSEITEDDLKQAENDIQKVHDNAIKELDKIAADKEKEIMSV
ncbi:MAG: ribosome recycling factor [Christensenellales bacterium]|uniref:Ribosome-recycling factor n=1 Tax=Candidatus Avichristensenella intestinipullorum TaxID=2840693 RepID=A0A9D1CKA7_9FIRM|nr:ribosome recycling factor [Christensenellales bacterium]HIQ63529.1 ribosome recycling factor [Candidatus Avichristensenella intestinipullorum]